MQCILNSSFAFHRILALENVKTQIVQIISLEPVAGRQRYIAVSPVHFSWPNVWNVLENEKPRENEQMQLE